MATIYYLCSKCGKAVQLHAGQSIFRSKLVWHSNYSCENCGSTVEMDDDGMPPDKIRYEILKTEGLWHLYVHDTEKKQRLIAIKEIMAALNIPFSEAKKLLNTIPGRVKSGTRTEIEWLKKFLLKHGINVTISME